MKKTFTTTISEDIQDKFRKRCKNDNVTMSEVLELFMLEYCN